MKIFSPTLLILGLVWATLQGYAKEDISFSDATMLYADLLSKYVEGDYVNYEEWYKNKEDLAALDTYVNALAEVDIDGLSRDEQMALYINTYNAAMIQIVFRHYSVKSVTDIAPDFGVFKEPFISLAGKMLSLDNVEKDILLTQWDDPRIHFAVNCASESCPPLRAEPFSADKLEEQLEEQTRLFANSDRAVIRGSSSKSYSVSALFDWYADDFPGNNPLKYLNQYREDKLKTRWKVSFQEYDWALNAPK